ncbi:MAG TPA: hypothetical protein VG013_06815, partial [Gemmataceae bacterium]|nr:hypothetical protein [Gemmataceae bacterium]
PQRPGVFEEGRRARVSGPCLARHGPPTADYAQPVLHWPVVAAVGAVALLFVVGLTMTTWLASRAAGSAKDGKSAAVAENAPAEVRQAVFQPAGPARQALDLTPVVIRAPARVAPPPVAAVASAPVKPPEVHAPEPTPDPAKTPSSDNSDNVQESPTAPEKAQPVPAAQPRAAARATYGSTVEFVRTPGEAARVARREHKLVFELQLSGNFEDPGCT